MTSESEPVGRRGARATDPEGGGRDPAAERATTRDVVRRRVLVSGSVQGVWYRESCREQAQMAGVSGWVRNLVDGRVEVVLEGPPAAVERVVQWCRRGPRRAQVIGVDVRDEGPVGERGFEVR